MDAKRRMCECCRAGQGLTCSRKRGWVNGLGRQQRAHLDGVEGVHDQHQVAAHDVVHLVEHARLPRREHQPRLPRRLPPQGAPPPVEPLVLLEACANSSQYDVGCSTLIKQHTVIYIPKKLRCFRTLPLMQPRFKGSGFCAKGPRGRPLLFNGRHIKA